jgi:hypothetical protein
MQEECCPMFDPIPWDDKVITWNNKRFIKAKVKTFFHMPIGFGKAMTKLQSEAENHGAKLDNNLSLSNHISKWNMELLLAVDKEVPTIENVFLSGDYYSRVYEGPFQDTGKWMEDYMKHIKNQNATIYMWYTTCPKCAKKYGKNYTVIISNIN